MKVVLITVWFAVSQGYQRPTEYYPQVAMQEFQSVSACQHAAIKIQKMAGYSKVETACIIDKKEN